MRPADSRRLFGRSTEGRLHAVPDHGNPLGGFAPAREPSHERRLLNRLEGHGRCLLRATSARESRSSHSWPLCALLGLIEFVFLIAMSASGQLESSTKKAR